MYDLLPLLWPRSGAPIQRCTICCRRFGLEARFVVVALVCQCYDVRFVVVALVSKWSPVLRCTICCRCFGLEVMLSICCCCFGLEVVPQCEDMRFCAFALDSKWSPNAKMYDLRPLLWSPRCPNAEMCDLLPLLWSRSGAPMPRCTICCRCLALEVVLQC